MSFHSPCGTVVYCTPYIICSWKVVVIAYEHIKKFVFCSVFAILRKSKTTTKGPFKYFVTQGGWDDLLTFVTRGGWVVCGV